GAPGEAAWATCPCPGGPFPEPGTNPIGRSGLPATATAPPPNPRLYALRHNWVPPGTWADRAPGLSCGPVATPCAAAPAGERDAAAAVIDVARTGPAMITMASAADRSASLITHLPARARRPACGGQRPDDRRRLPVGGTPGGSGRLASPCHPGHAIRRPGWRRPRASGRLLEQLPGDDRALDLGGALVDARRADLTVQLLQQVSPLQRPGSVDLHRRVHHELRRLGGEQLRHRAAPGDAGRPGVDGCRGR